MAMNANPKGDRMQTGKEKQQKTEKLIAGKKYWTVGKAAKYLGVCGNTVRNYTKLGLSCLKFGSSFYFREEWIKDFIDERTKIQTFREPR
jgi:hypothetical protein